MRAVLQACSFVRKSKKKIRKKHSTDWQVFYLNSDSKYLHTFCNIFKTRMSNHLQVSRNKI